MSNFFGKYSKRYVAQIVIEAATALNISSGETGILTDSLVMKDANGLPMILGTSLAGVIRHSVESDMKKDDINSIFGYQKENKDDGQGSRLIVSNAHFVGKDGIVIEGLQQIDWNDDFYSRFYELPVRQHTKITHKGAADTEKHGKFDEQVVYKGTRFKFEMELIGNDKDKDNWEKLISVIQDESFRIGGGTRKGFGKLRVESLFTKTYDLENNLEEYASKSASLNDKLSGDNVEYKKVDEYYSKNWTKYRLELEPEDFYLFGSGFGSPEVDMTPVYEDVIKWKGNNPTFEKEKILIPASSIKGAISHRVAFHYNKLVGNYADKIDNLDDYVGEKNHAVKQLFGFAKDSKNSKDNDDNGKRGNVIFSDVYLKNGKKTKILNHVKIDRFTGGAIDGALFDEEVIAQKDVINFEILVNKSILKEENVKKAFENTLKDIVTGMLPLGGGVMRGHGVFKGKIYRDDKEINNEF